MKFQHPRWILSLVMVLGFAQAQKGDTCEVLEGYLDQQAAFIAAYQNQALLEKAQKLNFNLNSYFDSVRKLSLQTLAEKRPSSLNKNNDRTRLPTAAMETHGNGTVWGLDAKGNHLPLVSRSGTVSEAIEDFLVKQYRADFGDAGSIIFYANLAHEMKHREQLRRIADSSQMTLEQYRNNEIEAYKVAVGILEQALEANGCD